MITDWVIAIGTVAVVFVAIFQDKIRAWLTRPKLNVEIHVSPPDCHKTGMQYSPLASSGSIATYVVTWPTAMAMVDTYYFRLRVTNTGNQQANQVEVFASELSKRQADGTFKPVDSFLPMNLLWSHLGQVFFPAISPNTYKHCDLAHIIDPKKRSEVSTEDKAWPNVQPDKTVLSLDTMVKSFALSHLIPHGTYRLVVVVAAANANPVTKTLEISLTGDWYDDEEKMLGEGIGIRVL